MDNYRKVRRAMNARLVRAQKAGRLGAELRTIEREVRLSWDNGEAEAKPRRKAR